MHQRRGSVYDKLIIQQGSNPTHHCAFFAYNIIINNGLQFQIKHDYNTIGTAGDPAYGWSGAQISTDTGYGKVDKGNTISYGSGFAATGGAVILKGFTYPRVPGFNPVVLLWPEDVNWPATEMDLVEDNNINSYAGPVWITTNHWADGTPDGAYEYHTINDVDLTTGTHEIAFVWQPELSTLKMYADGNLHITFTKEVPPAQFVYFGIGVYANAYSVTPVDSFNGQNAPYAGKCSSVEWWIDPNQYQTRGTGAYLDTGSGSNIVVAPATVKVTQPSPFYVSAGTTFTGTISANVALALLWKATQPATTDAGWVTATVSSSNTFTGVVQIKVTPKTRDPFIVSAALVSSVTWKWRFLNHAHDVLQAATRKASAVNHDQNLSGIRVGLHDEIFQGATPVLAGVDAASTYCYLLAAEQRRDADTWGVHLLDAAAQGLNPDYTIADAGQGLRAGQRAAWSDTPCHGDVFHIQRQCDGLANVLERLAKGATSRRQTLQAGMGRTGPRGSDDELATQRALARQAETQAHELARDVWTLTHWLRHDVLALAGPALAIRQALFDFIVEELAHREPRDARRIRPVRVALQNQRDTLLAFAGVLDGKLADIAQTHAISGSLVREACLLHRLPSTSPAYWQGWNRLRTTMGGKFHALFAAVSRAMAQTPRSSSLVENLNSRLRTYFTLRRHLGGAYLDLRRFFLNHRRFLRSRRAERQGKSPRELMTGQGHPHWLTLLGLGPLQPQRA